MAIVRRKLRNGKICYWVKFVFNGKDVWERAGANEREARALEARRKREVSAGTYRREHKGRVLMASWFDTWFASRTNRTVANDRALIDHHVLSLDWFAALPVQDLRVVGVAIVGRPVSRHLQDGWTAEVIRLASDGTENVCSFLYGASWRAARALGWRKLITYTLPEEGGASLRGAGWKCLGEAGGGSWNCPSRPRVDTHPTQMKLRWEVML